LGVRCGVWLGGNQFTIEHRPEPQPGSGQVRVAVHVCGVCLTDVHAVDGLFGGLTPPQVLGHECAGRVEALGADVTDFDVGANVVCVGSGGFAEQIVVSTNRLFRFSDAIPMERAALLEPLTACVAAVQGARLPLGASVLITGAGPMGLILLQLVRRGGGARVFVSEPDPARRELAVRLGAETAIDPTQRSVAEQVKELTNGAGAAVAFETAGLAAPLVQCLDAVRDHGEVVIVGVNAVSARLDLDLYTYHPRNLTLKWSWGPGDFGDFAHAIPAALPWLEQLALGELISHHFELGQLREAFGVARARQGLKVLVHTRRRTERDLSVT
jgi:2-desacetyl-2-hydroxyethyl bacteriochlorophyllide A dehydrogenase